MKKARKHKKLTFLAFAIDFAKEIILKISFLPSQEWLINS